MGTGDGVWLAVKLARGGKRQRIHGSLHGPGYSGGDPITRIYRLPEDENFVEDLALFPDKLAQVGEELLADLVLATIPVQIGRASCRERV